MVRLLIVTKVPRRTPIPDKPASFPPFDNLHLELLENKNKLKPGLPLIPIQRRRPPMPKKQESIQNVPEKQNPNTITIDTKNESENNRTHKTKKKRMKKKRKHRRKPSVESIESEDELVMELGESGDEESFEDEGEDGEETVEDEFSGGSGEEHSGTEGEDDEDDPYAGLSPEEREAMEKEEYIWRFRILKKQYKNPSVTIPAYNEHSDLQMMKTTYKRTIKELYLDDAVESYRTYLVGGFMAMEFACTQWASIDMKGFTIQQTQMMYKYDRLLVELGEKSYNTWGMNFPVEIRLIGLVLLQAGIFYLGKIISEKYGGQAADFFKGLTGQPPAQVQDKSNTQTGGVSRPPRGPPSRDQQPQTGNSNLPPQGGQSPRNRKRMRGPRIKPEDIQNMR